VRLDFAARSKEMQSVSQSDPTLSRAPDFFLVGAPKCATSSLHLLLIRHPGIFMCSPKEPHFFSTDLPGLGEVPDRAAYDALFAAAPPEAKRGEASAFYLRSRTAAAEIHKANPDARIILSIRNPADAAISLYHQLRDGFREDQKSFAAAWALQDARARGEKLPSYCPEPAQLQYRDVYSYHDQIKRYFDLFGRDAVKVLLFEDISANPDRVIAEVLDFIGVAPFDTAVEMPRTNTRRAPMFPGLVQFLTSPPAALRPLVGPVKSGLNRLGIKPSEVMMKHLSKPAQKAGGAVPPDVRREVVEAFRPDVERLEMLLDTDLSAWKA
jgi:hypothetical protein